MYVVVPSSFVTISCILVGSVLFTLSPVPNWPYSLYPHAYACPFPFNATKCNLPATIFGCTVLPLPFTFTFTAIYILFWVSVNLTYVVPFPFAVTFPSESTVATFSSNDLNNILPVDNSSVSKFRPIFSEYSIFLESPSTSKLIILFSLTSIFGLLIL